PLPDTTYFLYGPVALPDAGVALAHAADDFQRTGAFAVGEGHVVLVAVALDPHLQFPRQRIDHADAHAVQAAGEGVVAVVELAAGVQPSEDQLDARHLFLGVDVHRHAAAVVGDLAGAVAVQDHLDQPGVAGKGLVHGVVNDLLGQVVGARGVRVHPRAAADRVQPGQDLDVCGVVAAAHPPIVA